MKHNVSRSESGHVLLFAIATLLVLLAAGTAVWRIHENKKAPVVAVTVKTNGSPPVSAPVNTPLAAGSDNSSLQNDLTNLNSSLIQQNTDQNTVNSAVNDQQNEVSVPTN